MKLYGLALVKDEADIIAQSLTHALQFCDKVFVLDNGSEDDSWTITCDLADTAPGRLVPFAVDPSPYSRRLRAGMYEALRRELTAEDWFLQLDADEFLMHDPRPFLLDATARGYDRVRTWQAHFQFTDVDLAAWEAGEDNRSLPIADRRRYFVVDWREPRFWRNRPEQEWGEDVSSSVPLWARRVAPRSLVNRHYQYRDPEQIQRRLEVRQRARGRFAFQHSPMVDWREVVVPAAGLRYWDGISPIRPRPWRFYLRKAMQRLGRNGRSRSASTRGSPES